MKKHILLLFFVALAMACTTKNNKTANQDGPINIIMETDIGNDIDDAIAMDLLYKYLEAGKINLLGVCVNKDGVAPGEFIDILNTWYGHPDIPIGIIHDGAEGDPNAVNYAQSVVDMRDEAGNPAFARTVKDHANLPEATVVYRKLLSEAADNSVVIASVGFSTNLVRLLQTGADEYSELNGRELVEKKVKLLVTMAGDFKNLEHHEFNVVKDIPAARTIFGEWPTPVVTSPFEVGSVIKYPATSIENDFSWASLHPMVEAYKAYMKMPYDRETWDPTAVLYAVEGDSWFSVSEPGRITVTDEGSTLFTPDENGTRRYLSVNDEQAAAIKAHFIELVTAAPENRK